MTEIDPKQEPIAPVPPATPEVKVPDLSSAEKIAIFLEKSRLADYVDLMNQPWRLVWLNLIGGISRGVGLVIGGGIIAFIVIFVAIKILSTMLKHVGGLPWVGDQLEELIAWILGVVEQHKGG